MPQQFTTSSGVTLKIPGTYVEQKVSATSSSIGLAGVITLIGEADEGPDFTKEANLDANVFGPDAFADVVAKYGSGRIVDAFRNVIAASSDPEIVGSVSAVKIIKVNPSVAASAILARNGFGNYASLTARREGKLGNLIKYKSEIEVAENGPTTGLFSYMPHYTSPAITFSIRQNGSAPYAVNVPALLSGPNFVAALENLSVGTLATGGQALYPLTGLVGNVSLSILNPAQEIIQISIPGLIAPAHLPSVGDTLVIPDAGEFGATSASVLIGPANENRASYLITAVQNSSPTSTITAKRINTPSGAPAPIAVAPVAIGAVTDIICYAKVEAKNLTGQDRQCTVGLSSVTFTTTINTGSSFTMTVSTGWASIPMVGDYVKFTSPFAGVATGFYQVTAASASSFTCERLSMGSSGTTGSLVVTGPITAASQPFIVYKPVIDGLGKSMEIIGTPSVIAKNPSTGAAASWAVNEPLLVSATEYKNRIVISRNTLSETFVIGGDVVASISSSLANATITIGINDIVVSVGGVPQFSMDYKNFPTLKNVVDYIASQPGFYASVTSSKFENVLAKNLDRGTFNLSASKPLSNRPGRLKKDASDWLKKVGESALVKPELLSGQSGMPELITPDKFLSGGAKNGSTSANWSDAIEACEAVSTNFVVPLVSKDAIDDIADGETESSSTYSIDAINLAVKSHIVKMNALKARKNRIALLSKSASYEAQKEAAGELGPFKVGFAFQDVDALDASGQIKTFQPWMAAVLAAGMQAAAGYKGIVKRRINITGVSHPTFNPQKPSHLEDALTSGMLIIEPINTGGFRWVSDQLAYTIDDNFVYNSLQAVYIADLMALTLIQRFDNALVGKSVADIGAKVALSLLEAQMFDFLRLKWIAPSDDAPLGYKNAVIKLKGGVMQISVEVKLAGLIYFVPIVFEISQVEQSAGG